ncbi:aldehyde dehydrogenase family protein [Streptomyces sp. CA-106131]|uniref:aldehyde dehydrogenase family protein n=1 Tax=Streptomyces sp. CA-106131 TaxID=3240045 RepID=UPI003D8FAF85
MKTVTHWIGGKPFGEASGAFGTWGPVTDPTTGEVTTQVAMAGAEEADAAVAPAKEAYATWRTSPLAQRIAILFRYRALLDARRDDLAALITAEQGKVHADALAEVARGLEIVELACGLGMALKGDTSTEVSSRIDVASIRQPLGVIVGISPFNFPAMISMRMFPMAIACGNTFVHKPSSTAPSASMLLAELAAEAGVPDGVLNILHGDKVAVDALLDHPDVAAVSFVGSTPVARRVYSRASAGGKRVQALGSAKNHMLVLPDADLDAAADAAVSAAYGFVYRTALVVVWVRVPRRSAADGAASEDTGVGPMSTAVATPVRLSVRRSDESMVEDLEWQSVPLGLLHEARPWRTFRWYKGQQHYSGTYWSEHRAALHGGRVDACSMTCSPIPRSRSSAPSVTRCSRERESRSSRVTFSVSPSRSSCMTGSSFGRDAFAPLATSTWMLSRSTPWRRSGVDLMIGVLVGRRGAAVADEHVSESIGWTVHRR